MHLVSTVSRLKEAPNAPRNCLFNFSNSNWEDLTLQMVFSMAAILKLHYRVQPGWYVGLTA